MTQTAPIQACYYPAFVTAETAALYKAQAAWHLAPLGERIEITFPKTQAEAKSAAKLSDVIFFWQKDAFWGAAAGLRRKGLVVDEFAQQAVGDTLDAFVASKLKIDVAAHQSKFLQYVKTQKPNAKTATLIGSGPDVSALQKSPPQGVTSINIFLSTAIFNTPITEMYPPDIIIAADGPSQFGPSQTAEDYRKRAIEALRRYNCALLIPAQYWPSVQTHWPEDIGKQIYAVPLTPNVSSGHSFAENWHYEPTSNVLTSFGLPCAVGFVGNIRFTGISLSPREAAVNAHTQHWAHENEARYQRHIAPMLAAHPASGQDDGSYLERHHNRLSQALSAYAAKGISFTHMNNQTITPSTSGATHAIAPASPLKRKLFTLIAKAQHYPVAIAAGVFIFAGLLGAALEYTIGLSMLGFFIAGGFAAFFIIAVLFLRLRQNRLTAQLERKLSQQQAQQFANLSERLEAIEREQ